MKGLFFEDDGYFSRNDLETEIEGFFRDLSDPFPESIMDELMIIRHTQGTLTPIYYYGSECDGENEVAPEAIKERKMREMDFFIENLILKTHILEDEGVIAEDQKESLFDVVFRTDEYYIGLNNSSASFAELQARLGLTKEEFIGKLKTFSERIRNS